MNTSIAHIYSHMIAGSIPALRMDVEETIVRIASGVLQDARLHVLSVRDGDYVYYFAAPSRYITHAESFMTSLSMALPGHPEHRGDGVYVLENFHVAAVKRCGELFLLHAGQLDIEKAAQDYGLPVHAVANDIKQWPLESAYTLRQKLIEQTVGKVARAAGYVLAGCAALYVLLTLGETYLKWGAKDKVITRSSTEVVKQFQYISPLSEQLAHFQQISAAVVRAGGWIDGYIWRPGKDEAFEITLPGWVSKDYIEALGTGTTADYSIPDNLVVARKGDLEKMSKP